MEEAVDDWIAVETDSAASAWKSPIGFSHIIIRTGLSSYTRPTTRLARLVHFVVRKAKSA
jgi:hypothetical protein